jgi:cysteine-rich repeat protein
MHRRAGLRVSWQLTGVLALAGSGCGSESTATDGADATGSETGDGDGDPSTGDGDGDGDGDPDPVCGNGTVEGAEECDDGADNGPTANCYEDCTANVCGDGIVGPMEGCDDGNDIDGDECTNACALATCGDGVLGPDELCDDGNDDDFDACASTCVPSPGQAGTLTLEIEAIKQFELSWNPVFGASYYQILERAEPGGDYLLVSDGIEAESVSLTVPLYSRLNASYKLRACNTDGCTESEAVDVTGNLAEAVGYFKASNTDAADRFGHSVALSADGSTLAVGAVDEDSNAGLNGDGTDNSALQAGAVYVFVFEGGVWSQQAFVKASNADAGDHFGASVALSHDGSMLAVGALGEDSNATGVGGNQADNSADFAGAAYVFTREGETWSQQAYVKASNASASQEFGASVSLSADGSTLAVGANREASNATGINGDGTDQSAEYAGAVYVFVREGALWSEQAYVKASNTGEGDEFGRTLALSGDGNTLAVGAYYEASNATGINGDANNDEAIGSGAVYVFTRAGVLWSQQAYVKASNTDNNEYFGWSVALSDDGNTLAVGAHNEDSDATGVGGDDTSDAAPDSGAVYVFRREGGAWSQEAYVKASNTGDSDAFGLSVALSGDGNTLAVGAFGEDSSATGIGGDQTDVVADNAGAVYVFARVNEQWAQQAYVKAPTSSEWFGELVTLSADGRTLAVGNKRESSNAVGIGGDQTDNSAVSAGAVFLY